MNYRKLRKRRHFSEQIKVDFLEKMIELAENEYDLDLKKSSSSKPSTGSGKTGKQ